MVVCKAWDYIQVEVGGTTQPFWNVVGIVECTTVMYLTINIPFHVYSGTFVTQLGLQSTNYWNPFVGINERLFLKTNKVKFKHSRVGKAKDKVEIFFHMFRVLQLELVDF